MFKSSCDLDSLLRDGKPPYDQAVQKMGPPVNMLDRKKARAVHQNQGHLIPYSTSIAS